jgi:hypothetical protein
VSPDSVRNRFDQLAKQIGREALAPSGTTVVHDEIVPDAQHADLRHEPNPARTAERARLGLLGRLAERPCLIEVFSHAPDLAEVRGAIGKHLAFWQKRTRRARRRSRRALGDPSLWILAAGRPDAVLAGGVFTRVRGWPSGVYLGPAALNVGLVVASELPRVRSTLLVRLMAAGRASLRDAMDDLAALPADAHERQVASQTLLDLQHALTGQPQRADEEQEALNDMEDAFKRLEDAATRRAILRVLARRKLTLSRKEAGLIEACSDRRKLDRWLDRAVTAETVAEVLADTAPRRRRTKLSN